MPFVSRNLISSADLFLCQAHLYTWDINTAWDVMTAVAPTVKRYTGLLHPQLLSEARPFEPDADVLVPTHALVVSCSP